MLKKLKIILLVILLGAAPVGAQNFSVQKSEDFDRLDFETWVKILQLKNGNTLFMQMRNKEGIIVTIFDKNRKQVAQNTITSSKWSVDGLTEARKCGLYEINGEAVLFFYEFIRYPILYRLRINGETGKLVKEDDIGHLKMPHEANMFWKYTLGVMQAPICVDKDPGSDCYAVTFMEWNLEYCKAIITHYNGAHEKINEAPVTGYEGVLNKSVVVDGEKAVYFVGEVIKPKSRYLYKLIIAKLKRGDKTFAAKIINHDSDYENLETQLHYNHTTNQLQLATVSVEKTTVDRFHGIVTNYYETNLLYIDPETMNVIKGQHIEGRKIAEYAHKHIDEDFKFEGLTQQMVINKDNTLTFLMEKGAAGIVELSENGTEQRGYVINKVHGEGIFQISKRDNESYGNTASYFSFEYINTGNARYVLFNDDPRNFRKPENDSKPKVYNNISSANAVCYTLGDDKIDRSLLLGDPDKDTGAYINLKAASYNSETKVYTTLVTDSDKKRPHSRIAWITFK